MDTVLRDAEGNEVAVLGEATHGWYIKPLNSGTLYLNRFFSSRLNALMAWDAIRLAEKLNLQELAATLMQIAIAQHPSNPNMIIKRIVVGSGNYVMDFDSTNPVIGKPSPEGQLFTPGNVTVTPDAFRVLKDTADIGKYISRHVCGDWGYASRDEKESNNQALETGGEIVSFHVVPTGADESHGLMIVTSEDRTQTTVCLPGEA